MANYKSIDTPFANGLKLTLEMTPQTHGENQAMENVSLPKLLKCNR